MESPYFSIPPDREILSTRLFKYSREKLFDAWINPDKLQRWWGPAGFTNTFETFNPVPGGTWKFVMHGPEKGNYPNEVVFLEVNPPALISWNRISQPLFRVVVTFESAGPSSTLLTFRMQFNSKGECDKIRKFAADKNEENFDKLELVLAADS